MHAYKWNFYLAGFYGSEVGLHIIFMKRKLPEKILNILKKLYNMTEKTCFCCTIKQIQYLISMWKSYCTFRSLKIHRSFLANYHIMQLTITCGLVSLAVANLHPKYGAFSISQIFSFFKNQFAYVAWILTTLIYFLTDFWIQWFFLAVSW